MIADKVGWGRGNAGIEEHPPSIVDMQMATAFGSPQPAQNGQARPTATAAPATTTITPASQAKPDLGGGVGRRPPTTHIQMRILWYLCSNNNVLATMT